MKTMCAMLCGVLLSLAHVSMALAKNVAADPRIGNASDTGIARCPF